MIPIGIFNAFHLNILVKLFEINPFNRNIFRWYIFRIFIKSRLIIFIDNIDCCILFINAIIHCIDKIKHILMISY
jgi:hypothetical protein